MSAPGLEPAPPAPADPPPPPPPRPAIWPAFVGFGVLVALVVAIQLLIGVAIFVLHARELGQLHNPAAAMERVVQLITTGPGLIATLLGTCTGVISTALVGARLAGPSIIARLRLGPSRFSASSYLLGLVGALALGTVLDGLASRVPVKSFSLELLSHATEGPLRTFIPLLLVGSVCAGFGEEIFFRGFMQTTLVARWRRPAAIVTSALCFGLLHGDPVHSPLAFGMGLYLGFLCEEAQSTRPTIAIHILNNATSFLAGRYFPQSDDVLTTWPAIGLSVLVFAGCSWAIRRQAAPPSEPLTSLVP